MSDRLIRKVHNNEITMVDPNDLLGASFLHFDDPPENIWYQGRHYELKGKSIIRKIILFLLGLATGIILISAVFKYS